MKISLSFVQTSLAVALLAAASCKTANVQDSDMLSKNSSLQENSIQPPAVFDIWQKHILEETKGKKIQPDCVPTHFGPGEGTASRGIVVLIHGFTACPQQFFLVGKELAKLGFDVFLPLMPGQGRMPLAELDSKGVAKDDLSELPTGDKTDRLIRLALQINDLARAGSGIKVIGGLSGGAGLATAVAVEGNRIWNRAIFMAPFYKFRQPSSVITAIMDQIYPGFTVNYDAQCKLDRGIKGKRNGLCSVTVDAMRSMLDFGLSYRKRINSLTMPVMFVGAENDNTILNSEMLAASKDASNASVCLFYKGVPHSMLSRLENLTLDHAWNDSLEDSFVKFVGNGKTFATEGIGEGGMPLCKVVKKK